MPDLEDLNEQLFEASRLGNLDVVKALIPLTDPALNDSIALRMSAQYGHAACVRLLIPVSAPKAQGSNALRIAALNGHIECVKLLIPVTDPKARSSLAFIWAAYNGHADCVTLLLPVSDPLAADDNGLTASDHARSRGHFDVAGIIDAFIEANALSNSLPPRLAKPASRASL